MRKAPVTHLRPWLLLILLLSSSGCRTECHHPVPAPDTPADAPISCPVQVIPEPAVQERLAAERAACAFEAGATAEQTLGLDPALAAQLPIRHVVVVMRENRSFDHLLGRLAESGQAQAEAIPPSFMNVDGSGKVVLPFRPKSTRLGLNADHQWNGMHRGIHDGAMDGFVRNAGGSTFTDGHFAMSTYEPDQLPFLYWLANTWALSDRHFASLRSGTFPNRDFLLLGTNDGVKETGLGHHPKATTPTLFDALDRAGLTWAVYSDGELLSGALDWKRNQPGCHCLTDVFQHFDEGTLPNVVFIDGLPGEDDDHPAADLQRGEAWVRAIYQHAVHSPQWERLALIWTYDEGGGFSDHVPPPSTCVARPGEERFTVLGARVPFVVVSPWARPHSVSHEVQEHTAITRFIETVFNLPALTARDANSPGLLNLFDFSSCEPPMLHPPEAPLEGTGGCR
jgi:phospholipase C